MKNSKVNYFFYINFSIETFTNERQHLRNEISQLSDDEESTLDSSSEDSSNSSNAEIQLCESEWLFPEHGCALCETCFTCIKQKKNFTIEQCQRKSHAVRPSTTQFHHIVFYGATTDEYYRFFDEQPSYAAVLHEMHGSDIKVNVCKGCFPKMMSSIRDGM